MAEYLNLIPSASSLSLSLRDLGYSLETAIADIIDNSISAGAKEIDVFSLTVPENDSHFIAVIDNGSGMSLDDMIDAMRHGGPVNAKQRHYKDLGRFGLGLKTASFSQCRQLTVASRQNGKIVAAEWDLDHVVDSDKWEISILNELELNRLPLLDNLPQQGTIILWRKLDRPFEQQSGQVRSEILNKKLDHVREHLALVFHRFLSGELPLWGKINIRINGHSLEPFDPFCRKNSATQELPKETIRMPSNGEIIIQPYIIPHHSHMAEKEFRSFQIKSNYLANQGTYIYRNGRLLAWGDWLRLTVKSEKAKHARIMIDFPTALDNRWTIDIKKSKAFPPPEVRNRIRITLEKITESSIRIYKKRGQKLIAKDVFPVWERFAGDGGIKYYLNHNHPLLEELYANLNNENMKILQLYLDSIASSLPIETIYSDYSENPGDVSQDMAEEKEAIKKKFLSLKDIFFQSETDTKNFLNLLKSLHIFDKHWDYIEELNKEYLNEC